MESLLILAKEDTLKLNTQRVITNVIDLKNGKELVSFFDDYDWNLDSEKNKTKQKSLNLSVAFSAAVTACARITMSKIKTRNDFKLYFSYTVSIYIEIDNRDR